MRLSIAKDPIDVFERRILVSPVSEVALQQWLNTEVKALMKSPQWQIFLERYSAEKLSALPLERSQRIPAKVD